MTEPVALFVADNPDDAGVLSQLTAASKEGHHASWCWFDDEAMSAPDRGTSPSKHHSRPPEGDVDGISVTVRSLTESEPTRRHRFENKTNLEPKMGYEVHIERKLGDEISIQERQEVVENHPHVRMSQENSLADIQSSWRCKSS